MRKEREPGLIPSLNRSLNWKHSPRLRSQALIYSGCVTGFHSGKASAYVALSSLLGQIFLNSLYTVVIVWNRPNPCVATGLSWVVTGSRFFSVMSLVFLMCGWDVVISFEIHVGPVEKVDWTLVTNKIIHISQYNIIVWILNIWKKYIFFHLFLFFPL